MQITRVTLLCALVALLHRVFCVEQPSSSLMECHPRWQWLITNVQVFSVKFYMGNYKSRSPKLTVLYSNSETILSQFKAGKPPKAKDTLARTYIDGSGTKRCVGKLQLKSSQKYPKAFGRKMAENLKKYRQLVSSKPPATEDCLFCCLYFLSCLQCLFGVEAFLLEAPRLARWIRRPRIAAHWTLSSSFRTSCSSRTAGRTRTWTVALRTCCAKGSCTPWSTSSEHCTLKFNEAH